MADANLVDKIEQRYKNAKVQLARAEKAIYAKAFREELGTNDPTEESAMGLLKEFVRTAD